MKRFVVALGACLLLTVTVVGAGQPVNRSPQPAADPSAATQSAPEVIAAWGSQRFVEAQFGRQRSRDVVRVGSDYTLRADEQSGDLVVVGGTGRVEGESHDTVVVFGNAEIASTANILGSLVLIDSDANVAEGARVRGDLVVIGGRLTAPSTFAADGSHVVIDNSTLGGRFEGVFAWITRGLFWGRPIVPNLGWVWAAVVVFFFVYLLLTLVFEKPVGEVADVLARRPLSSFGVGLLVLLLVGPISVLLAVSIIGIAVVPLILCAMLVAWIIGKAAGTRWIGMSVMPASRDGRLQTVSAFVIGFVLITLAYMVPILGFVTWTMMGVFGLGASSLAFVAAYRRENPLPPPREPKAQPAVPILQQPAQEAMVSPETTSAVFESTATAPIVATPSLVGALPHASFRDRVAAGILDLILGVLTYQLLTDFGRPNVFFMFLIAYHIAFWTWKGTTVGGIICQLRVVRVDGGPLRFIDALVRGLSAIFSVVVLGLGVFWILRDPERQAWHDRIAGTYVVKVPRNWPL